jgi:threonine/homoserine efflux transporter RhtA
LAETGLSLVQTAPEIEGEAAVVFQGRVMAIPPGQAILIEFLGPVKVSRFLITLGQDVQDLQVVRLLQTGLLQLIHGQFCPADPPVI